MQGKDHYKILELPPSASLAEIKKAYRRLAHVYHPDKNNSDPYALAHFQAIKEAYEVLTNPGRKERYLQQRWYAQSRGQKKTGEIVTPATVLKQALELDKYVSLLDVHRMDKQGLQEYILALMTNDTIEKLNSFDDLAANKEITSAILRCSAALPINLFEPVCIQLHKIRNDPAESAVILQQFRLRIKNYQWEKYRAALLLLLVILICLLIYLFS